MNEERDRHAQKRSGIVALQRFMLDNLLVSDANEEPKMQVICEEVERSKSIVPQDVLAEIFHDLAVWENEKRMKVGEYATVHQKPSDVLPFLKDDKTNESQKEPKPKQRARKKKPAPDGTPA